jgi:hypothetical protein
MSFVFAFVVSVAVVVASSHVDAEQDQKKRNDSTQKTKPKPEEHKSFKTFQSGDYLIVASISEYKSLGAARPTATDGKARYFHRYQFKPVKDLRGNLIGKTKRLRDKHGLSKTENWKISGLWLCEQKELGANLRETDQACLVVLRNMRASSMAGNIPVQFVAIFPLTKELLEVAKAASKPKQKKTREKS